MKKTNNRKKTLLIVIAGLLIIFTLVGVYFMLIFPNNERALERSLRRMVTMHYQEDYFEALREHPEFMALFVEGGGIQISLATLEQNGFDVSNFKNRRTREDCSRDTTLGVINFTSNDFRNDFYIEVYLDCGF